MCLCFQQEPELNHAYSKSRPSSAASQRKDREEKASLPAYIQQHPNMCFILKHSFDSTGGPVDHSRTEPSSGGNRIIVATGRADDPVVLRGLASK